MSCQLLIVGECFADAEVTTRHSLTGKAGGELYRMMCEADFPIPPMTSHYPGALKMRSLWEDTNVKLTSVFNMKPPEGKIDNLLAKKKTIINKDDIALGILNEVKYVNIRDDLPAVKPAHYLRSEYYSHVEDLHALLKKEKPNLIIALGNTACWAILQTTKISALRGTICDSPFGKVLPMYHPAAVIRNYEFRPVTIMDLMKAEFEMKSPDFVKKKREIWIEPDIEDLYAWWEKYGKHSTMLSVDIETERATQVSEIGFASDDTHALHLPFIVDRVKSYWSSTEKEMKAWDFVRMVCKSKNPKVLQNGLYDLQFMWVKVGIPIFNMQEDTMLLHHALYPGLPKALSFLASVYANEVAYKGLRREGNKADA